MHSPGILINAFSYYTHMHTGKVFFGTITTLETFKYKNNIIFNDKTDNHAREGSKFI